MKKIVAIDDNREVVFVFNTIVQEYVEVFMIHLGYGNNEYILDYQDTMLGENTFRKNYLRTKVCVMTTFDPKDGTPITVFMLP